MGQGRGRDEATGGRHVSLCTSSPPPPHTDRGTHTRQGRGVGGLGEEISPRLGGYLLCRTGARTSKRRGSNPASPGNQGWCAQRIGPDRTREDRARTKPGLHPWTFVAEETLNLRHESSAACVSLAFAVESIDRVLRHSSQTTKATRTNPTELRSPWPPPCSATRSLCLPAGLQKCSLEAGEARSVRWELRAPPTPASTTPLDSKP